MAIQAPELEAQLPADAAGFPEVSPSNTMAPVFAIGGLGSVKRLWRFYSPLLAGPGESPLSTEERFFPIPKKGLGEFDEMYEELEENIVEAQEKVGERVVLACQSLGGLFGMKFGLNHPDKAAAVISMAGIHSGIEGETITAKGLKFMLGNPETAANLQADSDFMQEHTESIEAGWSQDTSVYLVAPPIDALVPKRRALSLKLPDGQTPEKKVVVPRLALPRGLGELAARKAFGVPEDAGLLSNVFGIVGHIGVAITPCVISYARGVRTEAAGVQESIALPGPATMTGSAVLAAA